MNLEDVWKRIENNDLSCFNGSQIRTSSGNYSVNSSFADRTFFSWAVRKSNLQTITDLHRKGADINLKESGGATPLFIAIYLNRFDVVQYLVKAGANILLRDSYNTPLTMAVQEANLDIIECLMDNGANTTDCDIRGLPPLILTVKANKLEIVNLFLRKKIGIEVVDACSNTPLIAAIRNDSSLDVIQCLLQHVEANQSKNEKTPLAWAAQNGNLSMIKLLLSHGANINLLSTDGNTPLATAVQYKKSEIAKFLIETGANVCKVGENGKTPLLWATLNQDLALIKYLLDHGADYIVDTVFFEAIETKNLEVVELLKEQGDLNISETKNLEITPLEKALEVQSVEIAQFFIANGASVVEDLKKDEISKIIKFFEEKNIEMVKLLTENGARLNESVNGGHTLLTKAVEMENLDMVKYFLARGANVNQANQKGLTPLAVAESNNDFQTFQFLVDRGAKVSDEDQAKNPKLTRYYRMAKESSVRRGKSSEEFGSNQEDADGK